MYDLIIVTEIANKKQVQTVGSMKDLLSNLTKLMDCKRLEK